MTRKRILVPVDFSTQSDAALLYAGKIAADMNEMISCIYVIDDSSSISDKPVSQEIKHKMRRKAEHKLSERVNSILGNDDNIKFELIVTFGQIAQKILEKSIDLRVRLIILNGSTKNFKTSESTGSTINQIIAHSEIPVHLINPQFKGISNLQES